MTRTIQQELEDSLLGRTVTGVKYDEGSGIVLIRCKSTDESDTPYFCFARAGFADASSMWPEV